MPIPLKCPCGKKLQVKDELAGRRVKCPACAAAITVPAAEAEFDVVEDEPPPPKARKNDPPAAKAAKKPVRAAVDEDDEDERPRKKSGRSRLDDDEDEKAERPRKKKKRKGRADADRPFWKTPFGMVLNGIGLIILGVAGIAIYLLDDREKMGLLIAGGLCICFGIGGIVTGMSGGSRDEDE
jgi:hypothetical protein